MQFLWKKSYTSRRKCVALLCILWKKHERISQTVTEKIIQLKLLGIGNGGSNTNWVIRSFECKTTTQLTFLSLSICAGFIFWELFWVVFGLKYEELRPLKNHFSWKPIVFLISDPIRNFKISLCQKMSSKNKPGHIPLILFCMQIYRGAHKKLIKYYTF